VRQQGLASGSSCESAALGNICNWRNPLREHDCMSLFVVFNQLNWFVGQFSRHCEKYRLAKQTLLRHNATMTERAVFTTDVVKDIGNPNRFRWNIYENQKVRDKSLYSFATKREAQSDADKFVRKLNSVWPASKE
jgi:hypothetical protein